MTAADVPLGMSLKDQAGWNQTGADWRRFLAMEPEGCFVAEADGRPVGTTVSAVLGDVGWIAMVLVEPAARGQGIGTRLVGHAISHLERRRVRTMRLDATSLGRPVYEKLGFAAEYEVARWEGIAPGPASDPRVGPVSPDQLRAIAELDQQVTGTDRHRLIEHLYRQQPEAMRVVRIRGEFAGYATLRPGTRAVHVGPAVAIEPEAGAILADAMLPMCVDQRVFVDIPVDNAPATDWAASRGLTVQRTWTRMRRGEPVHDRPPQLWASSGPENG